MLWAINVAAVSSIWIMVSRIVPIVYALTVEKITLRFWVKCLKFWKWRKNLDFLIVGC